ncbi:MAG: glutamate racemase [Desulfohalobiaceae bacterium]|nr:glutamate racemase [Desulfohalobiaceae bacterium]
MSRGSPRETNPHSVLDSQVGCGRVGVLDSGIGGVSVLRAIHSRFPHLDLIYVADTGHAPYGCLRAADIRQRSRRITEFLFRQGADAVVLACNTATATTIHSLRRIFFRPIVGMEPAIKPALSLTRTGRIGILATENTLGSFRFRELLLRWSGCAEILPQPCPDLVLEVEQGNWDGARIRSLLSSYIDPLLKQGTDVLVLGCTHYHFLRPLLGQIAGPDIAVLDASYPVARQLGRVLSQETPPSPRHASRGTVRFWTSGDTEFFRKQLDWIWESGSQIEKLPV